jgi:hypothetical protein
VTQYAELPCPKCQRELRVRTEYLGRVISCNYCDHSFRVHLHVATSGAPATEARTSLPETTTLDDKIRRLSRELGGEDTRATRLEEANQEVGRLRAQLAMAARDVDEARAARDQALADLAALRQEMNAVTSGHEQWLASLAEELEAQRAKEEQTEAARVEAVRGTEQLHAKVADLEGALRQAAEGHVAALDEARRQLEGEHSALQARIEQLHTEADGLRSERDRDAARRDEAAAARLTEEIARRRQASEAAAARERELEDRLEAIRAEAAAERGRADRAAEEQAQSAALHRDTEARLGSLQEQLDAERAARRCEAEGLRGELAALARDRDEIAARHEQAGRCHREDEGRFRGEVERLTTALADATKRHSLLAGARDQATAATRAVDEQLAAARRELAERDKRLAEQAKVQATAAAERESLQAALATAQKRLEKERTLRQREAEVARAEREAAKVQCAKAETSTAGLAEQLRSAQAGALQQRDVVAGLRREVEAARVVTAEACARAARAEEELAQQATRDKDWQQQLDAAHKQHEEERAGLQTTAERLRQERDDALRRAAAAAKATEEPALAARAAPERPWQATAAAYEAALARDLGPRRQPPVRPDASAEAPAAPVPPEVIGPAAEAEAAVPAGPPRPAPSRFPIWACLPLALLLWVASLAAGHPLLTQDSAFALLLAVTLLMQFRVWDELEDAGDDQLLRPESAPGRGPLHFMLALVVVWNAAYLAFSLSWPLLAIFVALSVVFLLWNRGLHRLFPGPIASSQVALLKYPVLVYLLAAPEPLAVPEGPFLLVLVLVYLGFSVFELLHDGRLRTAGSGAILALAMVLMLAVSAVMTAGMSDRAAWVRQVQVVLTGLGAAVFLVLFGRRRRGRALGGWAYLVFVIAFAWLVNFSLGGRDFT